MDANKEARIINPTRRRIPRRLQTTKTVNGSISDSWRPNLRRDNKYPPRFRQVLSYRPTPAAVPWHLLYVNVARRLQPRCSRSHPGRRRSYPALGICCEDRSEWGKEIVFWRRRAIYANREITSSVASVSFCWVEDRRDDAPLRDLLIGSVVGFLANLHLRVTARGYVFRGRLSGSHRQAVL